MDDHRDGSIGLDSDDIDHIYQNMKTEQTNSRSRTVLSRDNSSVTPEMAKSTTKLKKSRLEPTFESSTKLPASTTHEDYTVSQAPFYGQLASSTVYNSKQNLFSNMDKKLNISNLNTRTPNKDMIRDRGQSAKPSGIGDLTSMN